MRSRDKRGVRDAGARPLLCHSVGVPFAFPSGLRAVALWRIVLTSLLSRPPVRDAPEQVHEERSTLDLVVGVKLPIGPSNCGGERGQHQQHCSYGEHCVRRGVADQQEQRADHQAEQGQQEPS